MRPREDELKIDPEVLGTLLKIVIAQSTHSDVPSGQIGTDEPSKAIPERECASNVTSLRLMLATSNYLGSRLDNPSR